MVGMTIAVYAGMPAIADDIEIYTTAKLASSVVQPNVMFIVDTSGSMNDEVTVPNNYDYTQTYAGAYDSDSIYYSTGDVVPDSSSKDYFFKTANHCDASVKLYDNGVILDPVGPLESVGFFTAQIGQYNTKKNIWQPLSTKNDGERAYPIECQPDSGLHGETDASKPYIVDGGPWTSTVPADTNIPHQIWNYGAGSLTLYDGNYLNYRTNASVGTSVVSRIDVARDAVKAIVTSNNDIKIGLMRFDSKSMQWEGGAVMYPAIDVGASRNDFFSRLKTMNADGSTPLSETYYEALLYFGGKAVDYGDDAVPSNQTGTKENGNPKYYETPITSECQKNYIIYLTDGSPQLDYLNTARKNVLTGFDAGSCNTDPDPGINDYTLSHYNKDAFDSANSTRDNCLDELAGWARNNDVAERNFPAHEGKQTIKTYTIGFAFGDSPSDDLKAAQQLLTDTANAGGGEFHEAKDKDSLLGVFNKIIAEILAVNSTFSSPAVSVNAYNRATHLDDLYFTLFKPAAGAHWDGNLKKYKLATRLDANNQLESFIADASGAAAIDPATGFFTDDTVSYWTLGADSPDGQEASKGGAAGKLTNTRNVYTFTGNYSDANGVLTPSNGVLNSASNALDKANATVTDVMLGVAGYPEFFSGIPYRETLLDWAAGIDVLDDDNDNSTTDARRVVGDPLHAEPALVQYGETAAGDPDLVAYVATNDGYLHAFDTLTGNEYFAYVPQEKLTNLNYVFEDTGALGKSYGLDGSVIPWINDANFDSDLKDAGDFVYLYFGERRGGSDIFSLNVTSRTNPLLRWVIRGGTGDFAEMGQSWSTPNVEKLKLGGTKKTVLIFGGGYDTGQDTVTLRTPDAVGRAVYIVDANTGERLWWAGPAGSGADLQLPEMQYSIPSRIKPIDIDGDGYIDRLYVGDMGGQIFRFDIKETDSGGATNLASLVQGGRIANLASDGSINDVRRFYYPPDVALIIEPDRAPYLSLVAASGYRAHPLNENVHDRIYMIRENDVYNPPAGGVYTTVTENDLYDTTLNLIGDDGNATERKNAITNLASAKGWYITLEETNGSFIGEKGLSEPLILSGSAIVTTFIPDDVDPNSSSCTPKAGTGLIYYLNVTDGTPTFNLSSTSDSTRTRDDRHNYLERGGIPPSPAVIITEDGAPTLCVGTECGKAGLGLDIQKMYWYEVEQ
jgi:type IV pilus assembly protein PilY1